jgi:large subunit ribosomal protein L33
MIQEQSLKTEGLNVRENIQFKCSECGEENYLGSRNKRKHPQRMEIRKYCPRCNKMTIHKEKR